MNIPKIVLFEGRGIIRIKGESIPVTGRGGPIWVVRRLDPDIFYAIGS
jgi:hypothetical protein